MQRPAYTGIRVMGHTLQRALRTIAALAILMALVLLLLPHSPQHHGVVFACLLLLPVFLFDRVNVPQSLWAAGQTNQVLLPRKPTLSPRFQRPPPRAFRYTLLS